MLSCMFSSKMVRLIAVSFLLLATSLSVRTLAQVPTPASPQTSEEAARELVKVMKVREQYKQTTSAMMDQLRPALGSVATRVPEANRARYVEVMNQLLTKFMQSDPTELIEATIKLYAKYYTAEDIQGLQKFYASPLGEKMMTTMPKVSAELMGLSMQWNQAQTGRIMQDLLKEFPELNAAPAAPAQASPAPAGEHQHQ